MFAMMQLFSLKENERENFEVRGKMKMTQIEKRKDKKYRGILFKDAIFKIVTIWSQDLKKVFFDILPQLSLVSFSIRKHTIAAKIDSLQYAAQFALKKA